MNENDEVETQEDLLQRCKRTLNKIKDIYAPKYKNIVIVTHFMFLDCITATEYD